MGSPVIMYQPLWDYTTSTSSVNFSVPSEAIRVLIDRRTGGAVTPWIKIFCYCRTNERSNQADAQTQIQSVQGKAVSYVECDKKD